MEQAKQLEISNIGKASCVKFSLIEYKRISEAARSTGESIPALLKEAFFKRTKLTPVFDRESAQKLISAINKVGNNLNQIARRVNSDIYYGWHHELTQIDESLSKLRSLAVCKVEGK